MRIKSLFSLSLILVVITSLAQENAPKDSLKLGEKYYKTGYYKKAINPLSFALKFDENNADLNFKIGHCYLNSPIKTKARPYLEKAYSLNRKVDEDVVFELARSFHYEHNWDKAIEYYNKSIEAGNRKIDSYVDQCEFGKKISANPIDVTIDNLGENINSPYAEYAAVITADGNKLFFTSRRPETTGGSYDQTLDVWMEDVFYTEKDITGNWSLAKNVGKPINSDGHDATVNISGDGQTLFTYRSENENGGDIYISELNGDIWSEPKSIGEKINTKSNDVSASLSPNGKVLYFVTNKPGGVGGKDIYFSNKLDDGNWGEPKNIGKTINTTGDEDGVFMHADGKTLYFSSTGHKTIGGYDIFKTEVDSFGNWSKPENLGFPVNTADNDVFFVMTADGKEAFYSSGKIGGVGEKDLYKITFHETDKNLTLYSGVIKNESGDMLAGDIEVTIMKSGVLFNSLKSNSKTGEFSFSLPNGEDYEIQVKFNDLIPFKDEILLKNQTEYQELKKEIILMNGNKNKNLDYVYTIQVATRIEKNTAEKIKSRLLENGVKDVYVQKVVFTDTDETLYRVRIGKYDTLEEGMEVGNVIDKKLLPDGNFWVDNVRKENYFVAKKEYDILEE